MALSKDMSMEDHFTTHYIVARSGLETMWWTISYELHSNSVVKRAYMRFQGTWQSLLSSMVWIKTALE